MCNIYVAKIPSMYINGFLFKSEKAFFQLDSISNANAMFDDGCHSDIW